MLVPLCILDTRDSQSSKTLFSQGVHDVIHSAMKPKKWAVVSEKFAHPDDAYRLKMYRQLDSL